MNDKVALPAEVEQRIFKAADKMVAFRTAEQLSDWLIKYGVRELTDINRADVPFGDFANAMGLDASTNSTPKLLLRRAYAALVGDEKVTEGGNDARSERLRERFGIKTTIKDVPVADLLSEFDPSLVDDRVTRELKDRFGDKPVLIFTPGTKTLNIPVTVNYAKRLLRNESQLPYVPVGGALVAPVKIGEMPDQALAEDPMFPGVPLDKDSQMSTVNYVDYTDVGQSTRQFIRLIVLAGKVDPKNEQQVAALMYGMPVITQLSAVYKLVAVQYRELEERGDLPKLRVTKSSTGRKNDPFTNRTT